MVDNKILNTAMSSASLAEVDGLSERVNATDTVLDDAEGGERCVTQTNFAWLPAFTVCEGRCDAATPGGPSMSGHRGWLVLTTNDAAAIIHFLFSLQLQLPRGKRVPRPVHVQGLEKPGARRGTSAKGKKPAAALHQQHVASLAPPKERSVVLGDLSYFYYC